MHTPASIKLSVSACTFTYHSSPQASEIIRFELDEKKLSELLTQVEDVEKAIEKYAHA